MGKRGPQPTPTAILKQRDSSVLYNRDCEPIPTPGIPEMPAHFDAVMIAEWERITNDPGMQGVFTLIDRAVLIMACEQYGIYTAAAEQVRTEGSTFTDQNGNPRKHPAVDVMNSAYTNWMAASRRIGLTPADRTGIKTHDGSGHEFGRDPRGRKKKPKNVTPFAKV